MTKERKEEGYTGRICHAQCVFYREGKEEFLCGTYRFLVKHFSPEDLTGLPEKMEPDFSEDDWIMKNICKHCEFLVDGCDYREGNTSPPCGGYVVVEFLRKKGLF